MKLLVTGGAGFIGSNFVRYMMRADPDCRIVVLDKLTYSGNRANLTDVDADERFSFVQGDICEEAVVSETVAGCDVIVNFAAETHVDRSILDSSSFVRTDVEGTRTLLEAARSRDVGRYLQISTDEVYGDIPEGLRAQEDDAVKPRSPYSASKAAGDLMVQAYHVTHRLDTVIVRASNNFGPYQFPEKLIPLFITNAFDSRPLPVYGDGLQSRDWLYVEDHCAALKTVLERGVAGEIYNIGTGVERTNETVISEILKLTDAPESLVTLVADRPGHDRRYAMDCSKIASLGWQPQHQFSEGLVRTVDWYRSQESWWRASRSEEFESYYHTQYSERLQRAGA